MPPGAGTSWANTWCAGSTARSVTHSGWLRWNGAGSARRRSGGSSASRATISSVSRGRSKAWAGSIIAIFRVCMCMVGVSM